MIKVPLKNAEYWVMRIVGSTDDLQVVARCRAQLDAGAFTIVNKDVVEPLSCHRDEETALIAAQSFTRRTGQAAKVVLNADM